MLNAGNEAGYAKWTRAQRLICGVNESMGNHTPNAHERGLYLSLLSGDPLKNYERERDDEVAREMAAHDAEAAKFKAYRDARRDGKDAEWCAANPGFVACPPS
jgi:hypothetical protein